MSRSGFVLFGLLLMLSVPLAADPGDVQTFELAWQPQSVSWTLSRSFDQSEPFPAEPSVSDTSVYRGTLDYHGRTDDPSVVGYLWDQPAGILYVDLNKDGDLTNDPDGVLRNEDDSGSAYQSFEPFRLTFSTPNGSFPYVIKSDMQGYEGYQYANFHIQSGFDGEVELNGRRWRFEFSDAFQGAVRHGSRFSLFPHEEGLTNAVVSMEAPKRLFLDGRCYETAFALDKSTAGTPVLKCTLTEQALPTGSLRINGQWINQLVLAHDDMLVLPSLTEEAAIVPLGRLEVRHCYLKYDPQKPMIQPRLNLPTVDVPENGQAVLAIGGPLQNSVAVHRSGRTLKFDYQLAGAGGETYDVQEVLGYDYDKKPSLAVYKGDLQVGAGTFEYG